MLKGLASTELITQLKSDASSQGLSLFKWTTADGKHDVIFRQIFKEDSTKIRHLTSNPGITPDDINEAVWTACVVWPELDIMDMKRMPAGIIATLSRVVQEKSGYVATDVKGNIMGPILEVHTLHRNEGWEPPTEETVLKVKAKHKGIGIHLIKIDNYYFVVRPLLLSDASKVGETDPHLGLCPMFTLWPNDIKWEELPFGVIETLKLLQERSVSGFDDSAVEVEEL